MMSMWMMVLTAIAMLLGGGCSALAAPAFTPLPQAQTEAFAVAPGVYMVRGATGEVDLDNLGRIGNAGFIVGESGVLAIDTGTSYRHGVALLDAIARVTNKPVKQVIVTHTRQEFLFGAQAYRERGIPVWMHARAARLMAARCEGCLRTLRRTLGEDEMRGTAMFKPDREVDGPQRIDTIGRPVELLYFGHSSGPGDVAVLDTGSGTLFAGGLVDWMRISDVQDSDLPGWKRALDDLRRLPVTAVVPGHGPLAPPAAIGSTLDYLNQLEARLLQLLERGVALSEVADQAHLASFAGWDQVETIHRRNASIVFLRLEREQMFK